MRPFFLVVALPALAALSLVACSESHGTTTDASVADGETPSCDPHVAPCTVTLRCDLEMQQGVDLATGEVTVIDRFTPIEPSDPVDLACYLGRFLVLQSNEDNAVVPGDDTGGLCAFGSHPPSSGIPRTTYAELGDVPSDESLCACTDGDCWGANLLCSVNATTGGPACVGFGMLARDRRREERYRVRVVDDGLQFITFEWLAVAR